MIRCLINYLTFILLAAHLAAQDAPQEDKPKTDSNATTTDQEESKSNRRQRIQFEVSQRGSDRVVFGDNVVVNEGEVVHDVVVIGGSAMIDGKVTGDLVIIGGLLTLGPKAEVKRGYTVVGGGVDADRAAKIDGERVAFDFDAGIPTIPGFKGATDWVSKGLLMGRPLVPQVRWSMIAAGIFILLYVVLALLFPGPLEASIGVLETRPGTSFLTGMLAFVLFAPLLLLLAITVVGLILVPFVVCALIALFLFGKVAVYGYTGRRLIGGVQALRHPVIVVLLGAILFCLLYMVPVLGFLLWGIVAMLGVGAVLLAFFSKVRRETPKPLPPEPTGTPPLATAPGTIAAPTSALSPPSLSPSTALGSRAGFWLRFVATLIDAALIIIVFVMFCNMLEPRGPGGFFLFVTLWAAYHIAMWASRGATIGGIALGLRLVQTDGQPVTLPVAIVRFLASFLSAAALLIGFFWAGWSSEKQSWHDKIAGTYVLKGVRSKAAPVSQPA